jgi:hypothetical protein
MKFTEYQNLTTISPLTQRVAYVIARESPVARAIPYEDVGDLSVMMVENQGLPTPAHRALNPASITEKTVPFGQRRETLKIMSDKVQVDRQFRNNRSSIVDPLAATIEGYSKAVAYENVSQFINGDPSVTVNEPAGLAWRFKNDLRLSDGSLNPATQKRVVDANNTNPDFTSAAARNKLFNAIHEALSIMDGGTCDLMITNRQVILGLSEAARNAGTLFQQTRDQYDRPLNLFGGIPIVDAGVKPAGVLDLATAQQVLPTSTTADDLVSDAIYLIKWGPTMLTGIQKGPLETIRFAPDKDSSAFPNHVVAFEWVYGFHLVNPYAIAVIRRAA